MCICTQGLQGLQNFQAVDFEFTTGADGESQWEMILPNKKKCMPPSCHRAMERFRQMRTSYRATEAEQSATVDCRLSDLGYKGR